MASVDSTIGHQLRAARRRRGWTRAQLADELGVSAGMIRGFETGETRIGPARLARISEALHHPLSGFFGGGTPAAPVSRGSALRGFETHVKAHERALARAYYVIGDFRSRTTRT